MVGTGAGTAWRGAAAVVVLLGGVPTACSGASDPVDGTVPAAGASATAVAGTAAARSGGSVGARGSARGLPVTFDIAAGWEAGAVRRRAGVSPAAEEAADALLCQGPVTAGREIGARPAGNIGFPRVRTGVPDAGDARTVLRAFVAAEGAVSEEKYRPFRAGGFEGAEVEYVRTSGILDESKQERALAVGTPAGRGVLHLGVLDTGGGTSGCSPPTNSPRGPRAPPERYAARRGGQLTPCRSGRGGYPTGARRPLCPAGTADRPVR
ncbi:lipoprotein [Streptomyces kebangsaanensis]|uniref:Lipoprotein n=1 Tax=Streptomyces kebangsaanensis TaxID=864058 RepID=A0ABW6L4T3_9ACTN